MRRKRWLIPLLWFWIGSVVASAETPKAIEVPPPPPRPDLSGLSPEKTQDAARRWRADTIKWKDSLTDDQCAELERRRKAELERSGYLPIPDGYDWRAIAKERGISAAGIEQLARSKILIGRKQYRQSFQPYTGAQVPVFITSDSLLNAFHVLFEDTFRELELRRAVQLRRHLDQAVTRVRDLLKKPPYLREELEPSWRQAQRAVGPAMVLLGTAVESFDADLRAEIETQVGKIREASAVGLPDWLAPQTEALVALDYRRLRPVGFYAEHPHLADYFRAVRWLQMVPFRIERDHELGGIALLGFGAKEDSDAPGKGFFEAYENFLGPVDGRSLRDAKDLLRAASGGKATTRWAVHLEQERKWLQPKASRVHDELRTPNRSAAPEPFRVLAAYRLLDAELFQILLDHNEPVTGLQVAALVGSSWAEAKQRAQLSEFAAAAIREAQVRLHSEDALMSKGPLYTEYLGVIGALFAPSDPDAPAFMAGEAWSAKSCQTALAGWAQMRHTFTLQAKITLLSLGAHDLPPGFIEPNPIFFRRFAEFVGRARGQVEKAEVFSPSAESTAASLLERADFLDRLRAIVQAGETGAVKPPPEFLEFESVRLDVFSELRGLVEREANDLDWLHVGPEKPEEFASALAKGSAVLRHVAKRYEMGEIKPPPSNEWESLSFRWRTLQETTLRFEALLQKQLRQRPWNREEADFIKEYGPTIATVMGYFGNVYDARDDAPRWVEVARDARVDQAFVAATGRPHAFYVLYPWAGMEVLCEGAVIPYYEYRSKDRLTDPEWRVQLDSPMAPALPVWIQGECEKK